MKSINENLPEEPQKDQSLRWMMRIIGLALVLISLFFIRKDITLSTTADWFFGFSALLGLLTFIAGFLPESKDTTPDENLASGLRD